MTFSIVARDRQSGAFGVATATGGPVVGVLVPHAQSQTGAIATQAMTNPLYGFDGLDLLARGLEAKAVVDHLTGGDAEAHRRQCIVIDKSGNTAAWTGSSCIPYAGSLQGDGVAVAGNMLKGPEVVEALLGGFEEAEGPLEDRLLAALRAADRAGGDIRGVRSAGLKVYLDQPYPLVDLRCDWSEKPLDGLGEVLGAMRSTGYAEFFSEVPKRPRASA